MLKYILVFIRSKIFCVVIYNVVIIVDRSLFIFNIKNQTRDTCMTKAFNLPRKQSFTFFCEINYTQYILHAINKRIYLTSVFYICGFAYSE